MERTGSTTGTKPWTGRARTCALALGLLLLCAARASAAGGMLDGTFGAGGVVALGTDADGAARDAKAMAVQADGRIVIVGGRSLSGQNTRWSVHRFLADGTLDTSFGASGRVLAFGTVANDAAWDVIAAPDGKIYVGGIVSRSVGTGKKAVIEWNYGVIRLLSDGSFDASWGAGGSTVVLLGKSGTQRARLALQPDGRVLLVGRHLAFTEFAVSRLTTTGVLDPTFGGGSGSQIFTLALPTSTYEVRSAVLDGSNRLVLAIGSSAATAVLRLTSSGQLDASFPMRNAKADYAASVPSLMVWGMALQADDSPVLCGSTTPSDGVLLRYTPNGLPDLNFGTGGVARTAGVVGDYGRQVAVDALGRLVVGLQVIPGSAGDSDVLVARFTPTGSLDASYGTGGYSTLVPQQITGPTGLRVGPDGTVTLSTQRTLIRLLGD